MATVVVALDGTRVNASDASTNWSKVNISGPAPASEAQNAYQNALAVNAKNTNTGAGNHGGLAYDYSGTGSINMTAATHPLAFMKVYVADFGALRTDDAVRTRIGSSSTQYYYYIVAGTSAARSVFNAYPDQGGYILCAINPNISAWRGGTGAGGAPTLSAINYFAGLAVFNTGGAKAENFAVDAIDTGRGLLLTRGDGADADGTFSSFVTSDQNTTSNRWGVVFTKAGVIYSIGRLTIGESGTATAFTDSGTDILVFPDGYYGVGDVGTYWDISNASSTIVLKGSRIIGRGSETTSDTRPDFTVNGTSGTFSMNGTILRNHRNITLTSVCAVTNADMECKLLTQSSADISNSVIRTNSASQVACLQSPTFGTTTDLHDTEFIQSGAGHAIELSTVDGTYTFTNLSFTGYGADTSNDAAIYVSAATGTTTINYTGTPPTYRSAGATVSRVASVPVTVTVVDKDNKPLENVQTSVHLVSDNSEVMNEDTHIVNAGSFVTNTVYKIVTVGTTDFTAIGASSNTVGVKFTATGAGSGTGTATDGVADATFTGSTPAPCYIRARKSSTGATKYHSFSTTGTIAPTSGLSTTIVLQKDPIVT